MANSQIDLVVGHPRFVDPDLAAEAAGKGCAAAWKKGFASKGADFLADVRGDFAVGIRLESGDTLLAVDRFAIRSLCYCVVGDTLHFAERADDFGALATETDPQAIYDYLYFHVIPSPRTIYQGVFRLPPAHYALFRDGRLMLGRYWHPRFVEPADVDFAGLREEFLGLIERAVRRLLDGSRPGCFLSGGTDSSTVAGMLARASGTPAASYSIGFAEDGYDEIGYARIAARHFGTQHHEYYVSPDDLLRSIPSVAQHYDQPFGNSSALPAYYCAKMAREDGLTRIFAGDGGDELFGGNSRYAKQKLFGLYATVPAPLRSALIEPLLLGTRLGDLPLLGKMASYVRQAKVPLPDRTQRYNLISRLGSETVLTAEFLDRVDQLLPLQQQREVWAETGSASQTNLELAFDWRYTLAECDLPKVVGTTSLAGLEVAFPMLDDDLVDFSTRLPSAYKVKGLKLRWFFKEALRDFLPEEIIAKKKKGFGLPFGVWAAQHAGLRSFAEDSVRLLVEQRIMRADFTDALFRRHLYEHPAYYGEMIWIAMMLAQWLARPPGSSAEQAAFGEGDRP